MTNWIIFYINIFSIKLRVLFVLSSKTLIFLVGIFVCPNIIFTLAKNCGKCGSFLMKQSLRQSQWLQNSLSILTYIHVSINCVLVSVISSAVLLDMALGAPIHLRHSWISLTTDNLHFANLFKQKRSTSDPKRLRFVIYLWRIQKHLNHIWESINNKIK